MGKKICVWGDTWLDGPGSGCVISPKGDLPINTKVEEFINQDSKEWRVDLVRKIFLPFEADKTLRIPISRLGHDDVLCWGLSSDGIFRVCDIYRFAMASRDFPSASSGPDPVWARLWKLNVPPKVREFSWRACSDILPHGVNLARKGVSDFLLCFRCGSEENLKHLFFDCPWAKDFWSNANIFPVGTPSLSFMDTVDWLWNTQGKDCVESFVTMGWQLWRARNEGIFKDIQDPPRLCVRKARDWLHDYQKAMARDRASKEAQIRSQQWKRPQGEFIKINVDGAFSASDEKQGIGLIARDSEGSVVLAGSKTLWHKGSAEMVEAKAVL